MRCISAAYVVMRCLCVRLSVTFMDHVKTNKHIFEIFSPSGSHTILVVSYQTGWRYSDGNPSNGGVECRCGKQKNAILDEYLASLHIGLLCYQPYESRSVKTKPRGTAASVEHTAVSVVRTRRRGSVCDGLDVIRLRGVQTSRGHNPLGHNPRFLLP